MELPDGEKVFR